MSRFTTLLMILVATLIGLAEAHADTPRSLSYLQNSLRDGQAAGSITPGVIRDFLASVLGPTNSVSGLTNVLSYACGVPINDGGVHTVATAPTGSCFNGVTTLAGLAAININGQTPFSFLTASGGTIGPLCTTGGSTNCFTNGVYSLTNTSVANMDIAWLAIQAALIGGRVYVPAGTYIVGSTENLPLMIPYSATGMGAAPAHQLMLAGDGRDVSVITAGHDFGALSGDATLGIPLISCMDPAGQHVNNLGRYSSGSEGTCSGLIQNISFQGPVTGFGTFWPAGSIHAFMDGVALATGLYTVNTSSRAFYNDYSQTGAHTAHINMLAEGGAHAYYLAYPNPSDVGDLMFYDATLDGDSIGGLVVNGNATLFATFDGESYINGPYAILGEAGGCADIMAGTIFEHLMTEYVGNAYFQDDTGYSGTGTSGTYTDANKCRGMEAVIHYWYMNWSNGNFWGGSGGRRRRASVDLKSFDGEIDNISVAGGFPLPTADSVGSAGIAMFNLKGAGNSYQGIKLNGDMYSIFQTSTTLGIPIFNNNMTGPGATGTGIEWNQFGGISGEFTTFAQQGNYTSTKVGDVMEYQVFTANAASPGGTTANAPPMGIAAQAGVTNGNVLPLQTRGYSFVNTGFQTDSGGYMKKSTGIGPIAITTAGSGGTNGTFAWTATGGGCTTEPTGSYVVSSNHVTAIYATQNSQTASGAGCTSVPTITLSGSSGLTGATVTPQWPAATADGASGPTDGIAIGRTTGFSIGDTSTGTSQTYMHLNFPQ